MLDVFAFLEGGEQFVKMHVAASRGKTRPQLLGQLPPDRASPWFIFERVGVDYAGPPLIKLGRVRRSTISKAYFAVFVSLSVKAVHLELVTDLSTDEPLATETLPINFFPP